MSKVTYKIEGCAEEYIYELDSLISLKYINDDELMQIAEYASNDFAKEHSAFDQFPLNMEIYIDDEYCGTFGIELEYVPWFTATSKNNC